MEKDPVVKLFDQALENIGATEVTKDNFDALMAELDTLNWELGK